ncbi:clarin-3 [Chaetodon trifascialis]|uniref:clarin-3 n=1 Tax=Chaetodon trifascialis TaxID=109706 RepID=UPI0039963B58
MPSTKKTIYFMSSALVTAIAIGILGFAMSTEWAKMTMKCGKDSDNLNGTAVITLKLFQGDLVRVSCPVFGNPQPEIFQVFPKVMEAGSSPAALHILTVCLMALCLLFSAATILTSLYNSVSNPYENYMGPVGIYAYSSLSTCLSVLVLILFAVNISVTSMAEELTKNIAHNDDLHLKDKSTEMQTGFYLVIPYTVLSLLAIALIYMYDHAAYTHRKEQQKPTEDAPKETMMY